jgi:hypothetical protein
MLNLFISQLSFFQILAEQNQYIGPQKQLITLKISLIPAHFLLVS